MATLEIPVNGRYSSQVMTTVLDGVRYRLSVYYLFRPATWFLDIRTDKEEDLIVGVRLVPDWPLIGRYHVEGKPAGEFIVEDRDGTGVPPGRNDFGKGKRTRLLYQEAA